MFQHVTVLVSFIFAIALTHLFSSASQLILARERVRFSWLLSVSMLNAALGVIINWLDRASPWVGDPELFQLFACANALQGKRSARHGNVL